MKELNIGMIGLDTSHVIAFTKLLHNQSGKYHVKGGKVVAAFPDGSPDFALSMSRLDKFTQELKQTYGVKIVDSMKAVVEESDAILIESVDGAQHLEQLQKIASCRKPIFIDKPLSLSSQEADVMIRLADKYETPIMSSSALRFAEGLQAVIHAFPDRHVVGADCFGPMYLEEEQPGFFWYGIHTIEMLYSLLGAGIKEVTTESNSDYDVITGVWKDGRIGTVRGNRVGNEQFGAVIHYDDGSEYVAIKSSDKPFYASLLEEIICFFRDGNSRVHLQETREMILFIEAANKSKQTGEKQYV
ncbi:Gfo/Idh/MocA family protein [Terrihalobacillus insolitus]|uniref:Gfo/Idh/MocA family protein n=1 Tax=Terrihalobacillus insolitus TaxID=2950438 RepID=UPI0023424F34|nr:Gfo/Idh/MocA family oxidoreductase [Terrihalobacillus insolitus]MDC3412168.1 Gfo/Idh/MocA family oxidoreductase [Terrihalobacillus insolitus]